MTTSTSRLWASFSLVLFVFAGLAGGVSCGREGAEPAAAADGPSIVLIIIDALRADVLGSYGHPLDTSPELDRLAEQGVTFARALSQTSWTRPSIGSMLTSLYPRTLGIHEEMRGVLGQEVETLAEALHAHGYRTVGATANPHLNRAFQFDQGFDTYIDSTSVFEWMEPVAGVEDAGKAYRQVSARSLFGQVLEAIDQEDPSRRSAPHYLQFDVMDVHETWHPHNNLVRQPYLEMFDQVPPRHARLRRYLQAVRQVSADIDWFLQELVLRPAFADTLLVITSDHGEGLYSHPAVSDSVGHGKLLYETQVHVPWILYSNSGRLPAGLVVDQPVRLLELKPTILDIVGIPTGGRGLSMWPTIQGRGRAALPSAFIVETRGFGHEKLAVYTESWKLFDNRTAHAGLPRRELVPIRSGGGGSENGYKTDQSALHPDVVARLRRSLREWEEAIPMAEPVIGASGPDAELIEQLERIGYVDP